MRHIVGTGLILFLVGCISTPPKKDDEELFGIYLEHMARMQNSLDELEYITTDNLARQELDKIKKNAEIARNNRPSDFEEGIEEYFQEFLETINSLYTVPWNEERFRQLDNSCSHCHERDP